ncbi:unnamed protein product [Chrysoparadoxa australica]
MMEGLPMIGNGFAPGESIMLAQSHYIADTLDRLYDQQIFYTSKIQQQRQRIEDLNFRIKRTTKDLEEKRKLIEPPTKNGKRMLGNAHTREIQKMENVLQHTLNKGSVLAAQNNKLKAGVDALRREMITEKSAKEMLEAELQKKKVACAEIMKHTQQMHDEREKCRRTIEQLKQEIVKELDSFQEEYHGLTEQMSITRVGAATEGRVKLDSLIQNKSTVSLGSNADKSLPPAVSHAMKLRQQSNMAYWTILKKKNELQSKANRAEELQLMLEKIADATGLPTLGEFVPMMLEAEEENYSLFKLINELNKELEELDLEKSTIANEIERLGQGSHSSRQERMKAELQAQIERSKSKAEEFDEQYRRDLDVIKSIEESIVSVFNRVGSPDEAISRQLLAMGVTERNVMMFLGIIEQQLEHIVQVYNAATDGNPLTNMRRPATPKIDMATGERIPSLRAPHPPSSDQVDELFELDEEEATDGKLAPMSVTKASLSIIKEANISKSQGNTRPAGKGKGLPQDGSSRPQAQTDITSKGKASETQPAEATN